MASKTTLSLQEITDYLCEEDVEISEIFIEPPNPNVNSDEDSADEDSGGLVDNLNGRQLQAPAEAVLANGNRIGGEDFDCTFGPTSPHVSDSNNDSSDHSTVPEPARKKKKNKPQQPVGRRRPGRGARVPRKKVKWTRGNLGTASTTALFPDPNYAAYREKSPIELFEIFFDDELVTFLVDQLTRYAFFITCPDPKISLEEMRCFISILILSGYNQLPTKISFRDSGDDMQNSLVYNAMRRDRFMQIMRFVHCADNTKIDPNDKMFKLRPLMEDLIKKFLDNFKPVQQLDYDESMIEYYGRHSCKQFIRGKPIRFGYKVWCLNVNNGYLTNFEVYQGSLPNANLEYEIDFGKSAAPMVQMIDEIPSPELPYRFYFDNLFTGMNLLNHLKDYGYGGTGTFRENRVPKDCPLTGTKLIKKKERGVFDHAFSEDENIIIARWMDNAVVTVASTCHDINPITKVTRYSQKEKKKVQIPHPFLIGEYKYMGGTDRMDENVGKYRIGIRGKKWWWATFTWLIDISVNNAWILMRNTGSDITHLDFRRQVVQSYLTRFKIPPKGAGRPSSSKGSLSGHQVADDVSFDRTDHWIVSVAENKRRRCNNERCKSVGRTQCSKCNVGLCVPCFAPYHHK